MINFCSTFFLRVPTPATWALAVAVWIANNYIILWQKYIYLLTLKVTTNLCRFFVDLWTFDKRYPNFQQFIFIFSNTYLKISLTVRIIARVQNSTKNWIRAQIAGRFTIIFARSSKSSRKIIVLPVISTICAFYGKWISRQSAIFFIQPILLDSELFSVHKSIAMLICPSNC